MIRHKTAAQDPQAGEVGVPFETFFEREYPSVTRALVLLTGNGAEAEELAEDAFARAWSAWDRVGTMASPAGYVYKTALNLHRNRLRRLARSCAIVSDRCRAGIPRPQWRRGMGSGGR